MRIDGYQRKERPQHACLKRGTTHLSCCAAEGEEKLLQPFISSESRSVALSLWSENPGGPSKVTEKHVGRFKSVYGHMHTYWNPFKGMQAKTDESCWLKQLLTPEVVE